MAAEIRVDTIKAEDGISAPTFPSGVSVTGVITATTLQQSVSGEFTAGSLKVGSNIQVGNAGIITATNFIGSGANLTGIDTDLVSDTSPQLGGNLDVNTKNIVFGDSGSASDDRLTFGAGTDLSIYHDGSHSRIDETGTGNLMIQSDNAVFIKKGTSENIAIFNADLICSCPINSLKEFGRAKFKFLFIFSSAIIFESTILNSFFERGILDSPKLEEIIAIIKD